MAAGVALSLLLAILVLATRTTARNDVTNKCEIGSIHKSTVPAGGAQVKHLKILGTKITGDECMERCCSLGPASCQYLWVLEGSCIAVACEQDQQTSCQPKATTKTTSAYVEMRHSSTVSDELESVLDWMSSLVKASKGKQEKGDSPPIAATPTDEIVITLPTNEVHIFGNHSKDDKGISSYSWKLLSDHFVQPILENADKAILHVRNLISGTYQFSLMVTDTSGQSSRTTVLVRVNNGPTQADVITTMSSSAITEESTTYQSNPPTTPQATPASDMNADNDTVLIENDGIDYYTKRRNTLKIVIPVLLSLALLLVVTASITTACACCCQRNKDRMRRYYKYKKLPETIQKT